MIYINKTQTCKHYLGDKVDCTGDDHSPESSYTVYHKTTRTLHISAALASSSDSSKSLSRSEDMEGMDLRTYHHSGTWHTL